MWREPIYEMTQLRCIEVRGAGAGAGLGAWGWGCVPACRPASRGNRLLAGSRPLPAGSRRPASGIRPPALPAAPAANSFRRIPDLLQKRYKTNVLSKH